MQQLVDVLLELVQVEVFSRHVEVRVVLVLLALQHRQVYHLPFFVFETCVKLSRLLHFEHTLATIVFNSVNLLTLLFHQGRAEPQPTLIVLINDEEVASHIFLQVSVSLCLVDHFVPLSDGLAWAVSITDLVHSC